VVVRRDWLGRVLYARLCLMTCSVLRPMTSLTCYPKSSERGSGVGQAFSGSGARCKLCCCDPPEVFLDQNFEQGWS
jgi:hypothetical protein